MNQAIRLLLDKGPDRCSTMVPVEMLGTLLAETSSALRAMEAMMKQMTEQLGELIILAREGADKATEGNDMAEAVISSLDNLAKVIKDAAKT